MGRAVYPANGWGDFLNISAISARRNGHKEGQYCSDIVRCFPGATRQPEQTGLCIALYLRFSRSNNIFSLSVGERAKVGEDTKKVPLRHRAGCM
ncbi:hypothetical protein CBM2609_U10013 [Cupriavidus taiwanensis]|nr:hypothetical protein CBM2609_U10013 [Cupriavidus taiwanensis]